jgi:hypothetical protein
MSAFSAIRFLRAFLLTSVLRIAQVTTLDMMIRMVAAKTIQPPHDMCGTKSRMSTRNASNVTRSVGMVRIRRASKYRGDEEGAWKCAATPRPKHTSVNNAATGWTINMELSVLRVACEREKLSAPGPVKRPSVEYPTVTGRQSPSLHHPKTPRLYPWYFASGIPAMIGVDNVLSRRRTKAKKTGFVVRCVYSHWRLSRTYTILIEASLA